MVYLAKFTLAGYTRESPIANLYMSPLYLESYLNIKMGGTHTTTLDSTLLIYRIDLPIIFPLLNYK